MTKKNKTHTSMKAKCLLLSGTILTSVFVAGVAMAQDAGDDTIIVTGSRIGRDPNLTAPLPVQSVNADTFRLSGEPDLTDVLNDIPALLTSTTTEGSIDGIFAGATGGSRLNLRGLGAERTLVLVNGQRHVSGVAGSAIVDINSIPTALVERVDVLTGGASQVYGADAVTGVVNFILKDDFEGLSLNVSGGISGQGDGERVSASLLTGKNFADDRGNITLALDYSKRTHITFGDRDFSRNNGISDDLRNPARRFQFGDIDAASTPNFAAHFNPANGRFPRGFSIPSLSAAEGLFGAGNLTAAELALIDRAANAPARVHLPQPTFSISSNRGLIAPADFSSPAVDLDGNGVDDCLDSSVGFNSSFDFASSFGAAGGCWVVNDDGSVRPYQDGLISGVFNQFGGDGISNNFDADYLTPETENYVVNMLSHYDVTDNITAFVEMKFGFASADSGGPLNTFYDLLTVAPDNPFIPAELQTVANNAGGLFVTRDPTDLGPNINTQERTTYRIVGGIKGDIFDGMEYSLTGNYGRFERKTIDRNRVIIDRFFAAIDVTTDVGGNPVCRSDLAPGTVSPTTPFDIPLFDFGYFTFNPGDGQCRPANILGGPNSISAAAVDFITTTVINEFTLEQTIFNGTLVGDFDRFMTLPGGSIGFATGFEYRKEDSTSRFDQLVRGILPVTTVNGNEGQRVGEIGPFRQSSLVFDPASNISNDGGTFSVWETFAELQLPILTDRQFFEELTVSGGVRFAEYTTVGSTFSWGVSGTWSPIDDVRFRASYAKPIRAPNISELFSPEQGAFFRPNDPCDQTQIDSLITAGDPRGAISAANCQADGIAAGFSDPLSARFSGVTSGNANVKEETATTLSFGVILQPRWVDGLTITADFWDIEVADAISAVSAQDIVDNCYGSANFPNQFCDLFTRNTDVASPQFQGFNFLRQTQVNFAALKARGVDMQATYGFSHGENDFQVAVGANWLKRLDRFFDPGDPTAVDPERGELQRPKFAGNINGNWSRGPFTVGWQTQYQGVQALRSVEIETIDTNFGPAGLAGRTFIHDINGSYDVRDNIQVYGGVNNLTDRSPFITEQSFPYSPLGRYFFVGARLDL